MQPYNFMGLSGLGQVQPSASGATDNSLEQDLLSQLIGKPNQIMDEVSKARMLESLLAQQAATPTQSAGDKLLGPQGLLALLGTLGAGAIGGAPAAAGFGVGALGGASAAAELEKSQKRTAMEETSKRLDDALGRLDKSQQRFTTLVTSNPDLFIDPKTGEQTISPEVLGFYSTGVPFKLFAGTRRIMQRRDDSWAARNGLLTKALESASNPVDRRNIVDALFTNMEFDAPLELVNSLASASPEQLKPEAFNAIMRYGGASGLDALITAGENGWAPFDPRTLRMIKWQDPEAAANKVTPSDRFLELANEVNAWSMNEANRNRMREIRTEFGPKGEDAVSIAIAKEVLGGRAGDFAIYRDEAELRQPQDLAGIMKMYQTIRDKYKLGVGMSGIQGADPVSKMTDEEQNSYFWGLAEDAYGDQLQAVRDDQAKADLGLSSGVVARLRTDLGVGPADAAAAAKEIMAEALRRATRPDGSVDRARFEQEVQKVTNEAIKGASE